VTDSQHTQRGGKGKLGWDFIDLAVYNLEKHPRPSKVGCEKSDLAEDLIRSRYDDGGYSGGSTERPDLQRLLDDIRARKIDVIVVYKVDRLTRSLADFAKLVQLFDAHGVSFVSVTQQFNTTTSMGRLTLNVLLSFAQLCHRASSPTRLWQTTGGLFECPD
jgi:Resolvase, N terminal domain